MEKLMFFTASFLVIFAGAEATGNETAILENFCVDTLNQTIQDLNYCINYPNEVQTSGNIDPAILSYICCLGYNEGTMTHNYMVYMHASLIIEMGQIDTADKMPDFGNFIVMCMHLADENNLLQDVDYLYWLANGKTVAQCREVTP